MSSEDIHREATVVDNQGCGDQTDTQSPVDQSQTEVSTMDRASETQGNPHSMAASTLLQLRNRAFNNTPFDSRDNVLTGDSTRSDPVRLYGTGEGQPNYSRSWENGSCASRNTASFPNSMSMYSHINMQNTIVGLTNAISNLQREQINMHTRQENITGTLGQVLSVLQGLKDGSFPSASNQDSVQNMGFAQSAINNSTPLNPESLGDRCISNEGSRPFAETQTDTPQNDSSIERQYGSRSDSSIDRHHGSNHWTAASWNNQGAQFASHNGTDLAPAEENTEVRYRPITESTGYGLDPANHSQRYTGQPSYEGRPRVTFSETYRLGRDTIRGDDFQYERMPEAGEPHSFSRTQDSYRARSGRRQSSPENCGWKIPPYNGKEEWKVWINRFEAIADRRNWSEEVKLDNLLPKLQGKAGDFVFTQLSKDTLSCYRELVKELNSRFRVVETEKTFASKFSLRVQKEGETAEEYAADLKRLYAKAYKNRDSRTKREDLVRRFLDGMRDNEARFEIEFHKEPDDIDKAVYHAVNFAQTRWRSSSETNDGKRFKRYTRRTSLEYDSPSEGEALCETDEEEDRARRIPVKTDKPQARKTNKTDQQIQQANTATTEKNDSMMVLTDLIQTLVSQLKNQSSTTDRKPNQQQGKAGFSGRNKIQCYGCKEFGHIIRDCPKSDRLGSNTERGRGKPTSQLQGQPQLGNSLN